MQRINLKKTIQAVCFLLEREPGHRMNYMRMLKILYLADREALRLLQNPITRDRAVAMQRGPVLSATLDLIKGKHLHAAVWAKYIQKDNYDIEMVKRVSPGSLSAAEIDILGNIADQYQQFDEWDMVRKTHELPEFKRHDPGENGRNDIPLEEILDEVGLGKHAAEIAAEINGSSGLDRLLASVK